MRSSCVDISRVWEIVLVTAVRAELAGGVETSWLTSAGKTDRQYFDSMVNSWDREAAVAARREVCTHFPILNDFCRGWW